MRHRFLPPPASLPHERLANEVRDQDILEEEPSNTSLDTQGAQQHQPRYPGSPATPAWIGWGRSTRTTTPYSTRFRNAPKICSQFIETIQDEKAKVVAAVWGTESIQFLAALCTYSCSAPG